jgi:effector-binding domain-containing protein
MEKLDVEMGFPVSKPLPGKDDIKAGVIPKGNVLSCMYKGPYSGMEGPYNEMFAWIADNDYEATGVFYEYYYNSPDEVPESELLTKIVMPLK